MPHDHHHLSDQEIVDKVISELKAKQIRITEPRQAIIAYMVACRKHPTVEEIYNDLLPDYPAMSLATVYNNLNTLVEHGYVQEMKFSGVTSRYDFMLDRHYHVYCEECGRVADFPGTDIRPMIQDAIDYTGYQIDRWSVELFGICPECQAKNKQS